MDLFKNDRNFNDLLNDSQNHYVVEHNDLIRLAHSNLTAKELKIIDFIISKIKPEDENFTTIETSLYELNKSLNLNVRSGGVYNDMTIRLDKLASKRVYIYEDDIIEGKAIIIAHWLDSIKIKNNGAVSLRLSKELAPYLIQLKSTYTQYLLSDTAQLSSKYSIKLYKLLREAEKSKGKRTTVVKGTPEELKKLLDAPESYSFGQLNQKVLQPAMDEINLKIEDMDLSLAKGTRGRKVVQVEIYNNFYPISSQLDGEVPLSNWLNNSR